MLKRLFAFLTILFLVMQPLSANADVIVEPENDFYSRHKAQCVVLRRSFCVNDKYDSVPAKKEPGKNGEIGAIRKGETVYIEYSCLFKGEYWGLAAFNDSSRGYVHGWVKMDQLLVLYDYVAFEEDHAEEFYPYTGEYDEIKKASAAVIWSWPGSGEALWTVEGLDTENFSVSHAYKDGEGREWGFVTYLFGSRNVWICLSDPLNGDIPVFNPAPKPSVWESDTAHTDISQLANAQGNGFPVLLIIIALVIALAVGTSVLIKVFWKPNKS